MLTALIGLVTARALLGQLEYVVELRRHVSTSLAALSRLQRHLRRELLNRRRVKIARH